MVSQRNVLPASPKPSNYKLRITPNLTDFTFVGEVVITLSNNLQPTTLIMLNYAELEFDSGFVTSAAGERVQSFVKDDFKLDEKDMRVSLHLAQPISGVNWTLTIAYRGIINDKMHGFYRSKFTTSDGKDRYLGTTQFEAVDARRAFPCWDEPVHKASFDLTLVVDKNLRALSNMPEVNRVEIDSSLVAVTYDTTPIMSTYLLAWTIGEMEVISKTIQKTRGGETLVRVFATEGKSKQGEFALDVACKVLPLYEEFFGSDYFIPKCDLLAIPDFAAGAMENWGLITYRETALLCDDSSSAVHRQWVALVVAHELAHQWFGNLVTMEWWKELWLNEAFATWVEYFAVDVLFPEWNIFTQFVNDETGRALSLDALRSSHAVEVDVVNAQEIDEIFDAISYCKGGSVLRMAIEFIGIDAFRTGIRAYLKHFQFSNASTVDLWKFLGDAAGKPDLARVLELWTGSQGYPYLTVARTTPTTLSIQQNRFLSTGDTKPEEDEVIWSVPLLYRVAGESDTRATLFTERSGTVTIDNADAAWVKVNAKQAAFCRVKYDSEMLTSLLAAVSSKALGNVDRLSLISDYHAFAQGGFISTVDMLRLFGGYKDEDDYTVWCAIIAAEADIRAMVYTQGAAALSKLNAFFKALYAPALATLGYAPVASDNHRTAQLRASLFGRLTTIGDEAAIQAALQLYDNRDAAPIAADLRGTVYATAVRERGAVALAQMRSVAENTATDAMERSRALRAMASSRDAALLREVIDFGLSESVRAQDSLYIFVTIAGNPVSQALYIDCLTSKWLQFWTRLPGMMLGRIVKAVESSADSALADALEAFWPSVDEQQRQAMDRSFRQGVEGIRNNAAWAARDAAAVAAFVESL
ncbi:aminopeptidase, putative [Bodo saltans]|uniref:Aminopeptidase n=1 Tax=Bodo saltans TaxID=75058 RepID=A0A0S4JBK9_BODSA|nr:aminopeptidase, putative [Bodo saltans]|eukprot:CUG87639.1 aminopeptidase, putative [Bodo saltans]